VRVPSLGCPEYRTSRLCTRSSTAPGEFASALNVQRLETRCVVLGRQAYRGSYSSFSVSDSSNAQNSPQLFDDSEQLDRLPQLEYAELRILADQNQEKTLDSGAHQPCRRNSNTARVATAWTRSMRLAGD
jgi:hypothetical protein